MSTTLSEGTRAKNIVLLMADQFNARCLGVEGHPEAKTPRLDVLAASGTRFTRAYVQNPICTPSRISWLTGLYPHNHGYFGLSGPNAAWLPPAFAHFRAHGYVTGAVGKLHCPGGWLEPHLDYRREAYPYGDPFRTSDYGEYLRCAGLLVDRDDDLLPEWAAVGGRGQSLDARPSRLPYERGVDHWTAAQAIHFLQTRPRDRPFFLWVSIPRPHQVSTPSQEFWDIYPEERLTLPPNADDRLEDNGMRPLPRTCGRSASVPSDGHSSTTSVSCSPRWRTPAPTSASCTT
ncbi:MAG: sulfatase-like hydrolase/transferase [Chloroflexi bacterium]|nr:sulfatase-like hydrolase/transferase [Chloroflexota bacterium]